MGECKHEKNKSRCRVCSPHNFCEHGFLYFCRECGGKGICRHNKRKYYCWECNPANAELVKTSKDAPRDRPVRRTDCKHGRFKHFCQECSGKGICKHNRRRYRCSFCKKEKEAASALILLFQNKTKIG